MGAHATYENVTRRLAESVLGTEFAHLPSETVEQVKRVVLDSIGCALAGTITDRARIALEMIEEFGGNGEAVLIGAGRTSCPQAAFGNSELMNALDYDIIGPISGHIAPYVIPPSLAIAQRAHSSGKDLILALALANEVGGRSMSAFAQHKIVKDEPPYYEEHPRFTYASSIFGGVAGAARLLRLDQSQLCHALGIAGASSPVPATMKWQHMPGPAIMAKYNAWTGWTAQLATVAALAARRGFTGDTTILDGEFGYWNIVASPVFNVGNLLDGLGRDWHLDQVRYKLYPTCYIYHAGIQGICQLVREHRIDPAEITEIVVRGDRLMQTPNRMGVEVNTFADAQFFIRFNFALAVFHGDKPSPAWQLPETFNDPRIRALVPKVKLEEHPEFENYVRSAIGSGTVPILWSSIVEIAARGQRYTVEVPAPRGSKEFPASREDLVDKFRINASYSRIKTQKVDQVIDLILNLEKLDDVTEMFDLLAA